MQSIVFYARKGGVGKSTLAFTLACFASEQNLKVLLISTDPQGDSVLWASRSSLFPNRLIQSPLGFQTLWTPARTRESAVDLSSYEDFDLVVVDLPPAVEAIVDLRPTLWVIPLLDRNTLRNTLPAIDKLRALGGKIAWLPNGTDGLGPNECQQLHKGASEVVNTWMLPMIPFSMPLKRVAAHSCPPWKTVYGAGKPGTLAAMRSCEEILRMAGLPVAPESMRLWMESQSLPPSRPRPPATAGMRGNASVAAPRTLPPLAPSPSQRSVAPASSHLDSRVPPAERGWLASRNPPPAERGWPQEPRRREVPPQETWRQEEYPIENTRYYPAPQEQTPPRAPQPKPRPSRPAPLRQETRPPAPPSSFPEDLPPMTMMKKKKV